MAEPLLALRGIRAGYGDAVVLDDVSLEVPAEGSLAVLGRNGVGKSTLLLTIMGYTDVARGRITWRGADITALALATRPKVLLLDEPAAGVPHEESAELFVAIAGLSREISILFIEHDMNVVFRFASRIIVMVGGRVLVEGTPAEIAADPRVREVYLGGVRHG